MSYVIGDGKRHYHVMHGMAGGYMPNVNILTTTKQEALEVARDEVRRDKEEGMLVRKVANHEWHCDSDSTAYICEIQQCHMADCLQTT